MSKNTTLDTVENAVLMPHLEACFYLPDKLRREQVLNKVKFLLICLSEEVHPGVRMFGRYVGCERISAVFTVCGAVSCTHFQVWGSGESHVTQTQEISVYARLTKQTHKDVT